MKKRTIISIAIYSMTLFSNILLGDVDFDKNFYKSGTGGSVDVTAPPDYSYKPPPTDIKKVSTTISGTGSYSISTSGHSDIIMDSGAAVTFKPNDPEEEEITHYGFCTVVDVVGTLGGYALAGIGGYPYYFCEINATAYPPGSFLTAELTFSAEVTESNPYDVPTSGNSISFSKTFHASNFAGTSVALFITYCEIDFSATGTFSSTGTFSGTPIN
ncbi:MAG: hypothetical protein U9O87_03105 [Verrucomicrobiota bacterium]|nr:hypothetical protein [Verrucomicrobiota bacterium]